MSISSVHVANSLNLPPQRPGERCFIQALATRCPVADSIPLQETLVFISTVNSPYFDWRKGEKVWMHSKRSPLGFPEFAEPPCSGSNQWFPPHASSMCCQHHHLNLISITSHLHNSPPEHARHPSQSKASPSWLWTAWQQWRHMLCSPF